MKIVYKYDGNHYFTETACVDDNYVLKPSETFVPVPDGQLQPSVFTGNTWVGADEKTWQAQQDAARQANQKANPVTPSTDQQMINTLGVQVANLQATVTKLTTGGTK